MEILDQIMVIHIRVGTAMERGTAEQLTDNQIPINLFLIRIKYKITTKSK